MAMVSYDEAEFGNILDGFNATKSKIEELTSKINDSVSIIEQNWEGDDAMRARETDFKTIRENASKVEENVRQVTGLLNTAKENFGSLNYTKN